MLCEYWNTVTVRFGKAAKLLLLKRKTVSKIVSKLHTCNVVRKSRSDPGFSSVAGPCSCRVSVKCPAAPGKHLMPHSMEKDRKEQKPRCHMYVAHTFWTKVSAFYLK